MKYTTTVNITPEFLTKADLPDVDYYIKFQLAQKIIEMLTKEELEKLIQYKIYDYRTFDFQNCKDEILKMKIMNLQLRQMIEYNAKIEI